MRIITQTKIQKWGNSFGVRLPMEIITKKEILGGAPVQVSEHKGKIVIELLPKDKKETLKSLIAQIKPENLHNETDWGSASGKEAW